ncbi:hypothetical protein [Burkholderia metallica]|uniref:hypothetical protein n=1 Tax=Burkholderia metallica TaxID=488729 RepID=UPI000D19D584|nr:hypothetical protein [Burkholderia metallica]
MRDNAPAGPLASGPSSTIRLKLGGQSHTQPFQIAPRSSERGAFQQPVRGLRFAACDLVTRLSLVHGVTATAGIGYYDLHSSSGVGYGYGHVGLSYQHQTLQFDLLYIGTVGRARSQVQSALDNRWVIQAIQHF